ncbi:MAG: DUF2723 domain-containing protein [Candidatus Eisenbacteria bacterium]
MRKQTALIAAVGIPAIVYLWTLCPTVYGGDSGELAVAARFLGVPHPPGYPLWVLMGKLFTLIPVGDVAFRANLMSAVLTSLAIGFVFLLAYRLTDLLLPSLVGSLAIAFSRVIWSQATFAEVYALSFLLFSIVAYLAILWWKTREPRFLYGLALAYGLLLTAHQSAVLFAPILAAIVFAGRPGWRRLLLGGIFLSAGASVVLFVPFRSLAGSTINWPGNDSLSGITRNLLRMNWGSVQQNPYSLELFAGQAMGYLKLLVGGLTIPVFLVCVVGLIRMFLRRRGDCLLLLGVLSSLLVGLSLLINFSPDQAHLYQVSFFLAPVFVVLAVWIAEAMRVPGGPVSRVALRASRHVGGPRALRFPDEVTTGPVPRFRLAVAGILISGLPFGANFTFCDRGEFFLAREYGESILYSLPRNSVLFTSGDNETFIVGYLRLVEGIRPDVRVFNRKGYLFEDIYGLHSLPRSAWAARQAEAERPFLERYEEFVFYTEPPALNAASTSAAAQGVAAVSQVPSPTGVTVAFRPTGLVYQVLRERPPIPGANQGERDTALGARKTRRNTGILPGWGFEPTRVLLEPERFDFITRKFCITPYEMMAEAALRESDFENALLHYRECRKIGFDFPEARYNVGLLEWANGNFDDAARELLAATELERSERYPGDGLSALLSLGRVVDESGR